MSSQSIENDLRSHRVFQNVNDAFLKRISSKAQLQNQNKGKIIFVHGDTIERFYFIKTGWVKLFRETLNGAQAVFDILGESHLFGENVIFDNNTASYSAEIISPTQIISLPLSDLKTEIESNNKLALDMLQSMANHRRLQDKEMEHRTIQNASQRIGCFLLRLVDQNNNGPVVIHLPYDKTLVATRLGMQPETFSRALSKLRDKTGITINGATIEMESLNQLSNYSCAACSSEFPCKDLKS